MTRNSVGSLFNPSTTDAKAQGYWDSVSHTSVVVGFEGQNVLVAHPTTLRMGTVTCRYVIRVGARAAPEGTLH